MRSVDIVYGNITDVNGIMNDSHQPTVEVPTTMVAFITSSSLNINNYKDYSSPDVLSKSKIKDLRWTPSTLRVSDLFAIYPPVSYSFSSIGTIVGRLFDLKLSTTLYLGRISNCVLSLICFTFSIFLTRKSKHYLFFILALPSSLSLISSYSQDAFLLSVTALTMALMTTVSIQSNNYRIFGVTAGIAIIMLIRPHYFPLMIFFMFYLNSLGFCIKRILLLGGISVIPSVIWYMFVSSLIVKNMFHGVNEICQLRYAYTHPFYFLRAAIYAYRDEWTTIFTPYVSNKTIFPPFISISLGALTLILMIYNGFILSVEGRVNFFVLFILSCLSLLLITFGAYVNWTEYKAQVVSGIQGRYILPVLIAFVLPFSLISDDYFNWFLKLLMAIVLILTVVFVNFSSVIKVAEYFIYR